MGDRANVKFVDGMTKECMPIYFYTHWNGNELPETVRQGLIRAKNDDRLDDEPYLGRIIFSEMIKNNLMETTGFGISTNICDGSNRVIEIEVKHQFIWIKNKKWSFLNYIKEERSW